ncbi:MAG TPA: DUF4440 domain-containing protein [Chthoniobacterales bacterium]|jgi:hypothetical protein|nr:DUF4440 domain-containing protein [Chthoniobacterales bacterium]
MNKRSHLLVLLLGASCVAIIALAEKEDTAAVEIVNFEKARLAAFATADKAEFDRMMAHDATVVHSSGNVSTKADLMGVMRPSTPEQPLPVLTVEEPNARIYGDAAILIGNLVETAKDGRRELVLRFTNSYAKKDGRWQFIAGQLTTLSRERLATKLDPQAWSAYLGDYKNASGRIRTISAEGDKLFTAIGSEKVELFAQSPDQFFIKQADVLLVFVKDDSGRVVSLVNRRPNGDVIQEMKVK